GLALYFTLQLNDRFYFQLEAIPKSPYGAKNIKPYPVGDSSVDNIFKNGSVERKIKTISLPLLIRYRIGGLWFIETGPQIDWMLGGKDIFTVKSGNNELSNTINVDDDITKFDIGWAGGLVYKLKKDVSMAVGIRYFYGLTDIIKSTPGNQHNSAWLMSVYIPIGAGKAAAKRQKELEEKSKQ
ncbi:MAG TPA: porin family protein, partial [Puia sp.]|nr:porin family protein [Puia sp.]